ncbi:MAG: tyrosine decarboxylase MfnA [Candidatus Bathyarchaeota archaeon]|nr:tyrosine decarboxylase MfnA [Candidatus Bathyarchaeota archaeon]
MQDKPRTKAEVLARLKTALKNDERYKNGKIFCSMCTSPPLFAKEVHKLFLESNLGDKALFSGSSQLEKEVVATLAQLLHGKTAVGFLVSGGTEANLLAMLAARDQASTQTPEVILPESAHFSFHKICRLLKLKPVFARLDSNFRVDTDHVEQLLTKNTVAIVGTAGSAELGTVDPIDQLSVIATKNDVHLHVDAAFGGLVLPFIEYADNTLDFDFKLEGVRSITVDPHKMGMSTIPAGGILFRNNTYLKYLQTETPYLTEQTQYTFVGTRSAASVAATWAIFHLLGREGFKKTVKKCMQLTMFLASKLEKAGFEVLLRPTLNIVAFRYANSKMLADNLRRRGWFVSYVPRLDCIRVVIMPHSKRRHVVGLLRCINELQRQNV